MRSKVATPFLYMNSREDKIDEYNIRYTPEKNSADRLFSFLDDCTEKQKTVNIQFPLGVDVNQLWPFTKFDNMRVRLCAVEEFAQIDKLKERNIRFFFDEKFAACSWKQLRDQISLGCCQIYIADDLTHDLPKVYNVCNKNDVGIRCVVNHVHSTGPYRGMDATDWFIRPEDVETVSEYYDVFEFDCSLPGEKGSDYDWVKFDALYRTYITNGKYTGNLREINWQLGFDLHNASCLEAYVDRMECGFHCSHGDSTCERCKHHVELADQLYGKGIKIKTKG